MTSTQKRDHAGLFIVALLISIVVFYFSNNVMWLNDDIRYQYGFIETEGVLENNFNEIDGKIENVSDIFNSLYVHHKYVNGRDLAHFFVHMFCGLFGHTFFAVCNVMMYLLLISLVLRFCNIKITDLCAFSTVAILLFIGIRTRMTPAFQINYIWMFAIAIGFLILFRKYSDSKSAISLLWLSVYSLIAGSAHEGINIGIGCAIIIYWLSNIRRFTIAQYFMSISFGIGLIWLCLAPGNFVRLSTSEPIGFTTSCVNFLLNVRVFYILLVCVIIARFRNHKSLTEIYAENSFIWNAWAACILFNFFIGISAQRQLFGEEMLAIILSIRLLKDHSFSRFWLVAFSCVLLYYWWTQYKGTALVQEQYKSVCHQYAAQGDGEVFIDPIIIPAEYLTTNYYSTIPGEWTQESSRTSFGKSLHAKYRKGTGNISVLPAYLHGKDSVDLGNRIVPCGDGIYLLIQSKTSPAEFKVKRSISVPLLYTKEYAPMTVKFDNILKESPLWRARLLKEDDITIMHLSDNTVYID